MKEYICIFCNNKFESNRKSKYCSTLCQRASISHKYFLNNSEFVECKECGLRAKQLIQHIEKVHHITVEEYCKKYNCSRYDLTIESVHKQMSENILKACNEGRCGWQIGGKNPSQTIEVKNGRNSIFSKNYKGYDGLTIEEKIKKIKKVSSKAVEIMNSNHNNPLRIDYYISRGFSIDEAKYLLSKRQCTFSLQKCIEKYGKIEGIKKFNERQEKWQNSLKSKPIEEIERINASKMMNGKGYSKISQKLFKSIYDIIHTEYQQIYYATIKSENGFNEYQVHDIINKKNYFLDFYIKDNNKVIEFDGDYWHSEHRGNQERDRIRECELKKLGYINILHIKECDYIANPKKIIKECLDFIRK